MKHINKTRWADIAIDSPYHDGGSSHDDLVWQYKRKGMRATCHLGLGIVKGKKYNITIWRVADDITDFDGNLLDYNLMPQAFSYRAIATDNKGYEHKFNVKNIDKVFPLPKYWWIFRRSWWDIKEEEGSLG